MNKKKLLGAVLSGGLILIYYGVIIGCFIYLEDWTFERFPFITIFLLIFGIIFIALFVALLMRIKEIKNGEEEEARKY